MKWKLYLFLLAFFCLFAGLACKSKDNPNSSSDGFIEAQIGDTPWDADAFGLWLLVSKNGVITHYLTIVGLRETTTSSLETLDLSVVETNAIGEGVFNLAKLNDAGRSNSSFSDSEGAFDYVFTSGNLILELLTEQRARGTFSGRIKNDDGEELVVSNGVFNVRVELQESVE